jgi:hypothetical protein
LRYVALALIAVTALGPVASHAQGDTRPARATSVTFDFETGVKTTIFADGNVQEEGFDTARMRRVASKPSLANDVTSTASAR